MLPSNTVVNITCFAVLSEIVYHLFNVIYDKVSSTKIVHGTLTSSLITRFKQGPRAVKNHMPNEDFNMALFFPISRMLCKREEAGRKCRNQQCPFTHEETALSCLIETIELAQHSIDVCVYMITHSTLADVIINCQKRKLFVRVITDDKNSGEDGEVAGAQIGKFRAAGIPVRCSSSTFWMHHKFAILDNEVLINGSFNWTNQAVVGNFENILITSEKKSVNSFVKEFQRLWELLEPDVPL